MLDEVVERAGGNTIRTPVGDIQVSIKIREEDGIHGGEACGVYVFPDFHLAPEPFLAACKVLELMAKTGKSFGQLIGEIPIYPLLKAKISVPNVPKQYRAENRKNRPFFLYKNSPINMAKGPVKRTVSYMFEMGALDV